MDADRQTGEGASSQLWERSVSIMMQRRWDRDVACLQLLLRLPPWEGFWTWLQQPSA